MLRPQQKYAKGGNRQERVSQGAGESVLGKGGLGYIARRGIDFGTSVNLQTLEGVARMAAQQPLELLSLLPDIIPEVGLAAWNGLRLGCAPGNVRIKAMTIGAPGAARKDATDDAGEARKRAKSEAQTTPRSGKSEEAPDGTAAIEALFENLPDEVGSFEDALGRNFLMVLFGGMCAVEAVPGPRNTGIKEVWPINTLTLRFKREPDGTLALYQRQTSNPSGLGVYSAGFGGLYEPMPMERFFWSSLDGFPDDPYGRAPFAASLNEILRILSFMNSMLLAFKRVGMPRLEVGFDFEATAIAAKEIMGLTEPEEIDQWVQTKFLEAIAFYSDMAEDDAFFHDIKSKVGIIGPGKDMPNVQMIFDIIRWRLVIALKQNPVLMGFVNGSTETWSDVQWEIYSKGMAAIVQKAAYPYVKAANLHLQLLGLPYKAVAEYQPIRSIQRKEDAEAEKVEIENAARRRDEGWQTQDTSSMSVTGSAAVAPEPIWRPAAIQTSQTINRTVSE